MVKGQREKKGQFPKIITCPNEMVALSMADGYARATNKPQCVIVHVDVGTQGLGAAIHNASCGRVPVLIFAGLSPYTIEGELRGSRTEYIHWIQDVPDQKQIVAQYCRYVGEIKTGKNVKQIVNRALQFAMSDPKGPVYLVGAREVMEEEIEPYQLVQEHWAPVEPTALPSPGVVAIATALVNAESPLVITGYCGRNHTAVRELVKLADTVKGLRVLDTTGSDMCFPATHRGWLGLRYGIDDGIREADVILVIDCDVPWINTYCHPQPGTKVFHVDVDPLKNQMPVFYLAALKRYRAESCTAFQQLNDFLASDSFAEEKLRDTIFTERWTALEKSHQSLLASLAVLAQPPASPTDTAIKTPHLISLLRATVPASTIFAIEAVTNTVLVADQIQACEPGSWLNCGGGGLGWSGGGALGIKLATMERDGGGGRFVCCVVGDGTFLFTVPGSVWWVARRYGIPVLTIVLNNNGWHAPRRSALLVHPQGLASTASFEELGLSFTPSPDFAGIARASAGGGLWTRKVEKVGELKDVLEEGVRVVMSEEGKGGAVVEVLLG
ncbi:MAG: hypothetical protein M1813_009018 [Trichoglossum hirsutum]|nr:MAG: hypothetical protein M1813_009018 [Trichoglossum hirsutum]